MNLERARHNMVEQQIRPWEVLDQTVLDLLYVVRREEFVPAAYRELAFNDMEIPLTPGGVARGECMLQPKLEARFLQDMAPRKTDRVLEIGTGSGYMAALVAARTTSVLSVEINPALAEFATQNLRRAGVSNVTVATGDAARGWPGAAAYDLIVVSGSLPLLPDALLEQLAPGGKLFAVIGDPPIMEARLVTCLSRDAGAGARGTYKSIDLFETRIAPLANALQPKRFTF